MARAQGRHFKSFVKGYLEAALWSSTDEGDESGGEPLDDNYSVSDIADEYYGDDKGLRDAFEKLTDACRPYGSSYLYVGDDDCIYVSS